MEKKLVLVIPVLVFLLVIPSAFAACTPPASGDWVIDGTQNCNNINLITIFGNVIVPPSGSLILTDSNLKLGLPGTYILVNGSITADGASFSGLEGEASYKETDNQIILAGNINIQNSDFSYFTSGVIITGTVANFKNNEIYENWERGLVVQTNNARIEGNTIRDIRKTMGGPMCAFFCVWAKGQGLLVEGNHNEIIGNHIYEVEGGLFKGGLKVEGNDNTIQLNELEHNNFNMGVKGERNIIDQNTINSGGLVAISVSNSTDAEITSNIILKAVGVAIADSYSVNTYVYDNDISNAAVALASAESQDALFETNYVENVNVSIAIAGGSTGNVFDDIQNTNIQQGLMIYGASGNKIQNTDLSGSDVDISIDDPEHLIFQLLQQTPEPATSSNDLIDVDFTDFYFGNSDSKVYVKWFTDFNVTDGNGDLVDGAQLEGYQVNGSLEFSETTHSIIYDLPVTDYIADINGFTYYNSYTVNATKDGYTPNSVVQAIDEPGMMVNIVLDEITLIPPVADAGDFVYVDPYVSWIYNFSGSYDPDGEIVEYIVNWGEGPSESYTWPYIPHYYTTSGDKFVNLTVVDNDGLADSDYITVSVNWIEESVLNDRTTTPSTKKSKSIKLKL